MITEVQEGDKADVNKAVKAANEAFRYQELMCILGISTLYSVEDGPPFYVLMFVFGAKTF